MRNFLWIVLVSMAPMIELRAAIPIGCGMGLPAWQVYLAAVIGNMIPVPFIILFIRRIFVFIRRHWRGLNGLVDRIEERAARNIEKVQKYEILGLLLFVAVPLPGTGAWTGGLIAALLNIRLKRSLPTILLGVMIAGVIITIASYGIRMGVTAIAD